MKYTKKELIVGLNESINSNRNIIGYLDFCKNKFAKSSEILTKCFIKRFGFAGCTFEEIQKIIERIYF
jgi:hypothetical protein